MPMGFDEFLKEVAPLFGLQWRAFQRRGVRRKVEHRIAEIGLAHLDDYLLKVHKETEEKNQLSKILTITISRFFRDREVFQPLEHSIIPMLMTRGERRDFRVWSIGCASGEEPYSFSLLWKDKFEKAYPSVHLSILATDIDEKILERAQEGRYKRSSLKEVPEEIVQKYFKIENDFFVLNKTIRESGEFKKHDMIHEEPFSGMDIIFCRNLAFTYFSKECQMDVLKKITKSLNEDGYLIIGKDESLPLTYPTLFVPIYSAERIYQKFNPQSISEM